MTVPRVLFRNSGVLGKFSILGMSLLRGTHGRLVPPRSLLSFPSLPLSLPYFHCHFPPLIYLLGVWSLAVVGTQHSRLREDNNKIISLFNYLLSHAATAGRSIFRYRVWGGSRVSAAPNNRARLTRYNV